MEITWLGHSSFRLKGKNGTVVTDPFDSSMVGFKFPKVTADIVTVSHDHNDHNKATQVSGNQKPPKIISGPGEYEIGGISIFGIASYHDDNLGQARGPNTIYVITLDNIRICHLGDLGHKLTQDHLAQIGQVDIALVPVGGVFTLDASQAQEAVASMEPKIVIPMHYKESGVNNENFGQLAAVDQFIKEMGLEPQRVEKYSVSQEQLLEDMQLVILERKF